MEYFEIQAPNVTNAGLPYTAAKDAFEVALAETAGGFSKLPDVTGSWIDHGKLYRETMTPYRVACKAAQFEQLTAKAFELFPDQLAIFTARLGDATIHNRLAVAA